MRVHLYIWLCVLFRLLLMDITVVSLSLLEFIVSNSEGWKLEQKEFFVLPCRIFFVGSIREYQYSFDSSILIRLLSVRASFLTN